jgi:hypothetical protein
VPVENVGNSGVKNEGAFASSHDLEIEPPAEIPPTIKVDDNLRPRRHPRLDLTFSATPRSRVADRVVVHVPYRRPSRRRCRRGRGLDEQLTEPGDQEGQKERGGAANPGQPKAERRKGRRKKKK